MATLTFDRYGKSRVRVMKVIRNGTEHRVHDWNVQVLMQGDFESCFTDGDNSKILPTDTMKNTVYSVAHRSAANCIEDFAKDLIAHFLPRNPQVSKIEVEISQKTWDRVANHGSTFKYHGPEVFWTLVTDTRDVGTTVRSGIHGLTILKTSGSEFAGYIKDDWTTLAETHDRLFGTEANIEWAYNGTELDFFELRERITATLLQSFAHHHSLSVQHTLYAMAKDVLSECDDVTEIELLMPNRHCLLVNLSPFAQDNRNEVFVPTDEPHGTIHARLSR